jgi:hypothetical protein
MAKRGPKITLRLRMDAHFLDDAPSADVVADLPTPLPRP